MANNLFSVWFFEDSFIKYTLKYIESLNTTNIYKLNTQLKEATELYYPSFIKWYDGQGSCDSECFTMFFLSDIPDEDCDKFNNYLEFMHNNYVNEFLVMKNYIISEPYSDAKEILCNF